MFLPLSFVEFFRGFYSPEILGLCTSYLIGISVFTCFKILYVVTNLGRTNFSIRAFYPIFYHFKLISPDTMVFSACSDACERLSLYAFEKDSWLQLIPITFMALLTIGWYRSLYSFGSLFEIERTLAIFYIFGTTAKILVGRFKTQSFKLEISFQNKNSEEEDEDDFEENLASGSVEDTEELFEDVEDFEENNCDTLLKDCFNIMKE
jgi:hypothetical protein